MSHTPPLGNLLLSDQGRSGGKWHRMGAESMLGAGNTATSLTHSAAARISHEPMSGAFLIDLG